MPSGIAAPFKSGIAAPIPSGIAAPDGNTGNASSTKRERHHARGSATGCRRQSNAYVDADAYASQLRCSTAACSRHVRGTTGISGTEFAVGVRESREDVRKEARSLGHPLHSRQPLHLRRGASTTQYHGNREESEGHQKRCRSQEQAEALLLG